MKKTLLAMTISTLVMGAGTTFAAKEINLSKQPVTALAAYFVTPQTLNASVPMQGVKEISRSIGANKTMHVRVQQTYKNIPVFGAEGIAHVPNATGKNISYNTHFTMNGSFYQDLNTDLANAPSQVFTSVQAQKAADEAVKLAKIKYGTKNDIKNLNSQLIVYVNKEDNKAHYAFKVTMLVEPTDNARPAAPIYILDALTFEIYLKWNNIKSEMVDAGGNGGNAKNPLYYDAVHLKKLTMNRNAVKNICLFKDPDVYVFNFDKIKTYSRVESSLQHDAALESYTCTAPDPEHDGLYWDGSLDMENGGYSPSNDSIYNGNIIQDLYQQWYNVPMLSNPDGTPMILKMVVNVLDPALDDSGMLKLPTMARLNVYENAFWADDYKAIFLGDGGSETYPLTSLGVIAHEVSHGFTSEHANLQYMYQSGCLNESFSDMAAQTAELFAYGASSWQIGAEVMKEDGVSIRYMDQPSKDCSVGKKPGDLCSIDDVSQYAYMVKRARYYTWGNEDEMQSYIVHFGSGVYNRLFYTLATAQGWDAKAAFGVMVDANKNYWTSSSNYEQAACGIISAAKDKQADLTAVYNAIDTVGINRANCL